LRAVVSGAACRSGGFTSARRAPISTGCPGINATGGDVVVLLWLTSCKPDPDVPDEVITDASETASWAIRSAAPAAPLSFALDVEVDGPATVDVSWVATDDDHDGRSVFEVEGSTVDLPLLGFRGGRSYEVTVRVDERIVGEAQPVTTPEVLLPIHRIEVLTNELDPTERVQTLLPLWGGGFRANQAAVIDGDGEVVYVLEVEDEDRMFEARTHGDGLLLLVGREAVEIREVGWLGEVRRSFRSATDPEEGTPGTIRVDLPGRIHHDILPQDDGGYVVLSKTLRGVSDYPLDYDDPTVVGEATISADVVARFDGEGAVLWSHDLTRVLDPRRIGFDSLSNATERGAFEWGHANAAWVEPDGRVGVSLRHQDEIVLLDPVDGEIDWILGNMQNRNPTLAEPVLTPVGDISLPYHAHAARRSHDGLITVFDNGNWRASPGEILAADEPRPTENYSRLAAFEVDEAAMTVRQVYERELTGSVGKVYADGLGDHDLLPNGHALGTFGRIIARDGQMTTQHGGGEAESRIVEFDAEGREVWHLLQTIDPTVEPDGFASWRAERVVFPGQAPVAQ
jgi:hypothetical protein